MYLEKMHKVLVGVGAAVALGAGVLWVGSGNHGSREAVVSVEAAVRRVPPPADTAQTKPRTPKPAPAATVLSERKPIPIREPVPEPGRRPRKPTEGPKVAQKKPTPGC